MATPKARKTGNTLAALGMACLLIAGANACFVANDIKLVDQQEAGAGGSGGGTPDDDGFNPSGGGGEASGGFEACAEASEEAKLIPVNMFIAVDRSGSMNSDGKWNAARTAFNAFFTDPEADTLNVAMRFWPQGDCNENSCSTDGCAQPQVPLGSLSDMAQEEALVSLFNGTSPGGLTPMSAALAGATKWAKDHYTSTDGVEKTVVILLTDGAPTACQENINTIAQYAADAYVDAEVLTFAVGLQGSNESQLNTIAQAGNTSQGFFIGNGNAAGDLLAALKQIQETSVACTFAMPVGDDPTSPVDPEEVNITYTPGGASEPVTINKVAGESACGAADGWYYDDPTDPNLIQFCPATCDKVQLDENAKIDILLGCETQVN